LGALPVIGIRDAGERKASNEYTTKLEQCVEPNNTLLVHFSVVNTKQDPVRAHLEH